MQSEDRRAIAEPPRSPPPEHVPAVTLADPDDSFTPKPLIADLLRTRYCIPGSIFLVEHVDVLPLPPPRSKRWRAVRLLLGDGELCIQALLRPDMHRFLDTGTVKVGCYVRLGSFSIHQRPVVAGAGPKEMVYLVVDDCVTVGWHAALATPSPAEDADPNIKEDGARVLNVQVEEEEQRKGEEDDFIEDSDVETASMNEALARAQDPGPAEVDVPAKAYPTQRPTKSKQEDVYSRRRSVADEDDNDIDTREESQDDGAEEDGFEVMTVSPAKATQRRDEIANNNYSNLTRDAGETMGRSPVALPKDWTDPSVPLRLTSLRSIPHLPYKQNWSVNVLAIIKSLSGVGPFQFAPYVQRTARLADPSTNKHVQLTVFLDPEEFCPEVGKTVLLVGVKNHLFDGGSLKKYESDRHRHQITGGRWWFQSPRQFEWCDVEGMEKWWASSGLQGQNQDMS